MADFRRKEYRGSLLLVQECGPVDIVVDTEDKTVTPTLAKADTEYSIAGGGGSLEYVIPEQTVAFNGDPDQLVEITVDVSKLLNGDYVIIEVEEEEEPKWYSSSDYRENGEDVFVFPITIEGDVVGIYIDSSKYYIYQSRNIPRTITISAIKAPF